MPRTGYQIKLASTTAELKQLVASDGMAEYRLHCQIIDLLKLSGVTDRSRQDCFDCRT